jgi:hypothetical protein
MGGGIQIEIAGFQVMVRDEPDNYAEARSTANGIWNLLAGTTQEAINTVTYHQFVAQSSVFSIGPNEEDHIQVACNFLVWKDPTP